MSDVENILSQIVRVGIVSSINSKKVTARVTFSDQDDLTSYPLSVLVKNTDKNADYWMPDVGEQVLCIFLPVGIKQGWILGSFYDDTHIPPSNTEDKRVIKFGNGTVITNDRAANLLDINAQGDVSISATGTITLKAGVKVIIETPETEITGNAVVKGILTYCGGMVGSGGKTTASITGSVTVTGGDVSVDGIGLKAHHHVAQGEYSATTSAKK